jgi:hypothetical protein
MSRGHNYSPPVLTYNNICRVSTITVHQFLRTTIYLSTLCSVFFAYFSTLNFMLCNNLTEFHYYGTFVNTYSVYAILSFTAIHHPSVQFKTKYNSFFSLTRGQRLLSVPVVKTAISKFPPKPRYPVTGYVLLTGYVPL